MKSKVFFLLISLPFFAHSEILEGVAKNKKGDVIYKEKHTIKTDESGLNRFIQVEYSKPDGTYFAKMTSDFSVNKMIPETTFEDERFKSKIWLRIKNKSVEFEEFKNNKTVSTRNVPLEESMVAGQGFDNFIKANFAKLSKAPVDFKFGVLENKDFYSLTGYKRSLPSADEIEYGIKASNWLLRAFAGELRVVYDLKDKRLKSFSGRSNILDDSGNPQDVTIGYTWKNEP